MRRRTQIASRCLFVALLLAGIILSLLPASLLPPSWLPFVSEDGELAEKPTRLTVPGQPNSQTSAFVNIHMYDGACEMTLLREDGSKAWTAEMEEGTLTARWNCGYVLILDGHGERGEYYVFLGSRWHPFAPRGRILLFFSCLAALAGCLFVGRYREHVKEIGRRKLVFASCVLGVASLVVYSVVHEFGHVLFGTMLGGKVNYVVWTIFSGEPHVSFSHLPEHAQPWMSAGGLLLPTVVGFLLVCTWLALVRRLSWYIGACILLPGLQLLLGNLGLFVEVFGGSICGTGHGHLHGLSQYYAIPGALGLMIELFPAFVTLFLFAVVGHRLMSRKAYAHSRAESPGNQGLGPCKR